jgi:hypothetical protein
MENSKANRILAMNQVDNTAEKAVFTEIDTAMRHLLKTWVSSQKARKDWDFKTLIQSLDALTTDLMQLADNWEEHYNQIQQAVQADHDFVLSDDYPAQVEEALRTAGIPFRGEFPTYDFPPFRLIFSRDTGVIRLSLGRRSQQTKSFAPAHLATWVAGQYKRVSDSKFNAAQFCKELLTAYEMLNCLVLKHETVHWGHPVALKDIYRLLTLRQSTKQDYPEPLFIYDLARLKEQVDIHYEGYRFELVPSRNQASSFLLVNSQGQESRVNSLTIHDRDEN